MVNIIVLLLVLGTVTYTVFELKKELELQKRERQKDKEEYNLFKQVIQARIEELGYSLEFYTEEMKKGLEGQIKASNDLFNEWMTGEVND